MNELFELSDNGKLLVSVLDKTTRNVTIPDTVTIIGYNAFMGCSSLKSISIPNGVIEIGCSAFGGCTSLEIIEFPDSITTIDPYAFENTKWLENQPDGPVYINNMLLIIKGDIEGGNFTIKDGTKYIAGGAFEDCTSLESIDLPNSVTKIGIGEFRNCI